MGNTADKQFMLRALELARRAEAEGEVPVGAVVVRDGEVLGEGWNRTILLNDASAHAEILALRDAGKSERNYRLPGSTVYVTLEPCCMCAGAMIHARVGEVVYAASDPKTGADGGRFELLQSDEHNHRLDVRRGVLAEEAAGLLLEFFRRCR